MLSPTLTVKCSNIGRCTFADTGRLVGTGMRAPPLLRSSAPHHTHTEYPATSATQSHFALPVKKLVSNVNANDVQNSHRYVRSHGCADRPVARPKATLRRRRCEHPRAQLCSKTLVQLERRCVYVLNKRWLHRLCLLSAFLQVINQVGAFNLKATLNCEAFATEHSSTAHFDAKSFVGLAWRPAGESVCCGACCLELIERRVCQTNDSSCCGGARRRCSASSHNEQLCVFLHFQRSTVPDAQSGC